MYCVSVPLAAYCECVNVCGGGGRETHCEWCVGRLGLCYVQVHSVCVCVCVCVCVALGMLIE